jgi:hypothetical protein
MCIGVWRVQARISKAIGSPSAAVCSMKGNREVEELQDHVSDAHML